jgi:uncharacterized protein YjiS (DUF1127 family)
MATVIVSARSAAAPIGMRQLASSLRSRLHAAVDAAFRFRARRRDERILLAMTDSQLQDVGITRSDISRVVREGR